jgi:hypothetical protein
MLLKNASDSKPSIILDNALFDALSDVLSGVLIADNFKISKYSQNDYKRRADTLSLIRSSCR